MYKELTSIHSVSGQMYRDVDIIDDDHHIINSYSEVKTPHCGWKDSDHICNKACDVNCRNAQNLFNEIGVEY